MKFSRKSLFLAFVSVGLVGACFLVLEKPDPVRFPVPNGFDELVAASKAITPWSSISNASNPSVEDQRRILKLNAKALALARSGLRKEIMVDSASTSLPDYIINLQSLVSLFQMEVQVALVDSEPQRLLAAYTDSLDLASKSASGLPTFGMCSAASLLSWSRVTVLEGITNIVSTGDPKMCIAIARRLQMNSKTAPTFEDFDSAQRRSEELMPVSFRFDPRRIYSRVVGSERLERRSFGDLLISIRQAEAEAVRDLVATAFRLEHGRTATNWTELVPEYLPEIPRNATNNAPLPLL
jgi:hypothetical protein